MNRDELLKLFPEPFRVLDHGFVRLVDVMGDDDAITDAARVSYKKAAKKRTDRELIRYLMRHDHTSPFEMCEIKLHVKLPIFVARQWIRHRTANVNEVSGRYAVLPNEMYVPDVQVVGAQSKTNKQGRDVIDGPEVTATMKNFVARVCDGQVSDRIDYEAALAEDIPRELARINLPLAQYTEWYWKIDLKNLLHFLKLRTDGHAQWEIRQYANVIAQIVEAWVPVTWEAFEEYVVNAVKLPASMLWVIRSAVDRLFGDHVEYAEVEHLCSLDGYNLSDGEVKEMTEMLRRFIKAKEG